MAEPLKNQFDRNLVELLAGRFAAADTDFEPEAFITALLAGFPALELKDRINLVADELRAGLPGEYATALPLVVDVAESEGIEGFAAWPLCSFVERHGLVDPPASLEAMERLTRQFSCEFAIRPFLDHHLDLTLSYLHRWTHSDDEAVRRLPSEGTRPYLPWGPKVTALLDDPEIGVALLTELRHDPSETVRRSVANHLNDIARDRPERVVEIAADWSADPSIDPSMIRHALRSLVKKGDAGALGVLGFTTDAKVDVEEFTLTPGDLTLGNPIHLAATITSTATIAQRLVVDFVVHHVGANGRTSPKVFKWATIDLEPDQTVSLDKHRLIATASTRRYHAGTHRVELQIAGRVEADAAFDLLDSSG